MMLKKKVELQVQRFGMVRQIPGRINAELDCLLSPKTLSHAVFEGHFFKRLLYDPAGVRPMIRPPCCPSYYGSTSQLGL
jgi:hypothetical protein